MVSRKPIPPTLTPVASNNPQPPYPTTPNRDTLEHTDTYSPNLVHSPAFNLSNLDDVQRSGNNPWADKEDEDELPSSLRVGISRKSAEKPRDKEGLPAILRAGPLGASPQRSQEPQRVDTATTDPQPSWAAVASEVPKQHSGSSQNPNNPFLRAENSQQTLQENESSAEIWGDGMTGGVDMGGKRMAATLSVSDPPFSEFSPSYRPTNPYPGPTDPSNAAHDIWRSRQASIPVGPHDESPNTALIASSLPTMSPGAPQRPKPDTRQSSVSVTSSGTNRSNSSIGWDPGMDITTFDALTSRGYGLPGVGEVDESLHVHRTFQEQKEWDRKEREKREIEIASAAERAQREEQERRAEEEWHRGEEDVMRRAEQERQNRTGEIPNTGTSGGSAVEQAPHLPRRSHDGAPSLPPRRPSELIGGTSNSPATHGRTQTPKGTSETYQIKQVNWFDATSPRNPRKSPILVQNANGPCPLLALVNALTLSTPAGIETALVETLRVREQVSLGLLLNAVFDELMSGRRGDAAQGLPDVSELYEFLVTLHTGMNVNPRFVPLPPKPPNLMDASPDLQEPEIRPADRDENKPGIFESTREMRLYSTFSIPLIHGWLPPKDHPAYTSLDRSAKTYEDAQNLLFREEELVEKFERVGLSHEEQLLVEDIEIIKDYLLQSATQLTSFGLETMGRSLPSGGIAILFRNDHFSTLYKHPRSGQLLTLVTDMGYAGHPEVVWESLVDVNGEGAEFFSGDFRPVGHLLENQGSRGSGGQQIRSLLDDDENWITVERGSRRGNRTIPGGPGANNAGNSVVGSIGDRLGPSSNPARPSGPNTEQEDHDLALALQLQEEEEDRHRREVAQRQREDALSQQFLSGQPRPNATSAQSQQGTRARQQDVRPLIPPRRAVTSAENSSSRIHGPDAPPPSYEQAANSAPYHPPSSLRPTRRSAINEPSAYALQQSNTLPLASTPRTGGRAGQIRTQAQNLIGEVQGSAAVGVRRRSSAGPHIPPAAAAQDVEAGKKDCAVM
ncbi:hypothetical protein FGG08_007463 [Glutinoglossum americanum]|uniref:MINDY deubiquitinase domain-containing protein n=1 Tax=Glutinoglossum americanum TaxID=1670608 RepID=A0A9P8KZA7_9PEZI|nr:hypothetical protein FGG08_007463 [Glutinoglossum americanum]